MKLPIANPKLFYCVSKRTKPFIAHCYARAEHGTCRNSSALRQIGCSLLGVRGSGGPGARGSGGLCEECATHGVTPWPARTARPTWPHWRHPLPRACASVWLRVGRVAVAAPHRRPTATCTVNRSLMIVFDNDIDEGYGVNDDIE